MTLVRLMVALWMGGVEMWPSGVRGFFCESENTQGEKEMIFDVSYKSLCWSFSIALLGTGMEDGGYDGFAPFGKGAKR
jgi:hypothetical protein